MTLKKNKKVLLFILIVIWIMFIWGNSMTVAVESDQQSGRILEWINSLISVFGGLQLSSFVVRKAAHMFEFFVLAVLVSLFCKVQDCKTSRWAAWGIGVSCVVACLDEGIQLFVPGRAGRVSDVFIDLAGAVIGVLLVAGWTKLRMKKSK